MSQAGSAAGSEGSEGSVNSSWSRHHIVNDWGNPTPGYHAFRFFHWNELPTPTHAAHPLYHNDVPLTRRELSDYFTERQALHIDLLEHELEDMRKKLRHSVKRTTKHMKHLDFVRKYAIADLERPDEDRQRPLRLIREFIDGCIGPYFEQYHHEQIPPHPFGLPTSPDPSPGEYPPGRPEWQPLFSPGRQAVSPVYSPGAQVLCAAARRQSEVREAVETFPTLPRVEQRVQFWDEEAEGQIEWPNLQPHLPPIAPSVLSIWERRAQRLDLLHHGRAERIHEPPHLPGLNRILENPCFGFVHNEPGEITPQRKEDGATAGFAAATRNIYQINAQYPTVLIHDPRALHHAARQAANQQLPQVQAPAPPVNAPAPIDVQPVAPANVAQPAAQAPVQAPPAANIAAGQNVNQAVAQPPAATAPVNAPPVPNVQPAAPANAAPTAPQAPAAPAAPAPRGRKRKGEAPTREQPTRDAKKRAKFN